jgi:hypothetical protein
MDMMERMFSIRDTYEEPSKAESEEELTNEETAAFRLQIETIQTQSDQDQT